MNLKVILKSVHPISPFVYGTAAFIDPDKKDLGIVVPVSARANSKAVCSRCGKRGGIYDTSREARRFEFIPLWGLPVFLEYTMRRVNCRECNTAVIEKVPWAEGKNQTCDAYQLFLARWAKRMSWSEVAEVFGTSWGVVYRAVASVVAWGLAARKLDNVKAIGVDEIAVRKGQQYLTVVYQLDAGVRRLLWVGKERTEKTFEGFFEMLGKKQAEALEYIASDMWKPYLTVIAKHAAQAVHVLDRFHIVANVSKAVDEVRAEEAKSLARNGYEPILKKTRWCFLKRPENLTPTQSTKLADVLRYNLRSVRAYLLKESLDALWRYNTPHWAGWFLDRWCTRTMRSRLEPMKKIARSLRRHRPLILNWFRAQKELSSAAVEGLNANAKLAIRKARGFRTHEALEIALYHQLGRLPEPEMAHRFC